MSERDYLKRRKVARMLAEKEAVQKPKQGPTTIENGTPVKIDKNTIIFKKQKPCNKQSKTK